MGRTFWAEIVTEDAVALGDPVVVVFAVEVDEVGGGVLVGEYVLEHGQAYGDLLIEQHWLVTGKPALVQPGYYVAQVIAN